MHGLVVAGGARGHGHAHLCVLLADGWAAGRGRGRAWEMGISSAASICLSIAGGSSRRRGHQACGMQQDAQRPDSGAQRQSEGAGRSSMRGQCVLLVSCDDWHRGAACMRGVGKLGRAVWHDGGRGVAARARGCVGKLGRAVWHNGGHGVAARARSCVRRLGWVAWRGRVVAACGGGRVAAVVLDYACMLGLTLHGQCMVGAAVHCVVHCVVLHVRGVASCLACFCCCPHDGAAHSRRAMQAGRGGESAIPSRGQLSTLLVHRGPQPPEVLMRRFAAPASRSDASAMVSEHASARMHAMVGQR